MRNRTNTNNKSKTSPKPKKIDIMATYKVHESIPLLEFLYKRVNDSKNNIKTYLKNKQFLVNGIPISQFDHPLVDGDTVTFSRHRFKNEDKKAKETKLDIIYEDDDLLVINKPSGMLSIESDEEKINTMYNLATYYVSKKDKNKRLYLVHRIDRDTSGIIIFAKDEKLMNYLTKSWGNLVKKREYIAICEGKFDEKKGTIKSYLHQNQNNMMYSNNIKEKGQLSITHYKVLKENDNYSMLGVLIDTGRKNQIRVHMTDLGHPVAGDKKYKSETNPINRLCLHAYKLEFINPLNQKLYKFEAKIPKEFNQII